MKYRVLTTEELAELEKEFIRFLAVNGIPGPDWVKMKTTTPEKADGLIHAFSDMVFEKTLQNIEFLEIKTPEDYKTFHCLPDKIVLLGIRLEGDSDLNFTQNTPPAQMLDQLKRSGAKLFMYGAEKKYSKERNLELFEMMEKGCLISKGDMFRTLERLKK